MHSNPIKRRRFYHKICKMFSMGCRRSQTLTPGSCAKCKACKSLSYSTRCQDCSRGSTLRRLLLEQYFIVRKGHLHRITEYPEPERTQELSNPTLPLHTRVPFCRTPSNLSCSNRAQALLCSDRQHSVFHMTASVCFHSDITVGWWGGGTILMFITASIQGRGPAPTQIYGLDVSRS